MPEQNLQQWMAERERLGDKQPNKSERFHAREKTRHEVLKKEVQNARAALLQAEVSAHEINVENLPGNIAGKTEAMKITIDPVIFRDLTFATHTLAHEKAHKSGITNEGLAELAAIMKAKDTAMPEYAALVENAKKVVDIIGWQTALDLYKNEAYEFMFKIFVSKSLKSKSYTHCIEEFEKAFPELEVLVQKN